jgi:hypothetical protein
MTATAADNAPLVQIAVIIGSSRPGTVEKGVGRWTPEIADRRIDAAFALLDVAGFGLPDVGVAEAEKAAAAALLGRN